MKIAAFSESPADEAALGVLLAAVRGQSVEPVNVPANLQARGWPSVRDLLPNVLRHLFYRTDADALVVLADSDDTPVHVSDRDLPGGYEPRCRLCELRAVGRQTLDDLDGRIAGRTFRFAVALAVPAVESWWRCGPDVHATEQAWARGLPRGPFPFTRPDLKRAVYGTDRPSLPLEKVKMVAAANRLAANLTSLERSFPVGFGLMAADVRGW